MQPPADPPRRTTELRLVALAAAAAFVVVLWGGYDRRWHWTGFAHRAMLWDWLHVLLLPLAIAVAPLWVRHRSRLGLARHAVVAAVGGAFVVLVVLGYSLDLSWTGFPGNTLWDWLELLVLPLAVGLLPVWVELSRGLHRRHLVLAACAAAFLVVCIVGGYEYAWRWTGFRGNTLFDWLQLFLAPILLPIVLVPLATTWMTPEEAASAAVLQPSEIGVDVMARNEPGPDPAGDRL